MARVTNGSHGSQPHPGDSDRKGAEWSLAEDRKLAGVRDRLAKRYFELSRIVGSGDFPSHNVVTADIEDFSRTADFRANRT